jgi:hypothetical protein
MACKYLQYCTLVQSGLQSIVYNGLWRPTPIYIGLQRYTPAHIGCAMVYNSSQAMCIFPQMTEHFQYVTAYSHHRIEVQHASLGIQVHRDCCTVGGGGGGGGGGAAPPPPPPEYLRWFALVCSGIHRFAMGHEYPYLH